jgi:hypoxanthine phosphoribosyltransferase
MRELISPERIAARVGELAAEIDAWIGNDEATVVCCLKGAFVFCADLVRALKSRRVSVDFLAVESYAGTHTTGSVRLTKDLSIDVRGRKVLVVEDILDTGLTLDRVLRHLRETHRPSETRLCVLLDKPAGRKTAIPADWTGFEVGDAFVVGYGLDCDERYRNLPGIAVLESID